MCYRCDICRTVSPPRQSVMRHVIPRMIRSGATLRQEIFRELTVCPDCATLLGRGHNPDQVAAERPRAADRTPKPVALPRPMHVARPTVLLGRRVVLGGKKGS